MRPSITPRSTLDRSTLTDPRWAATEVLSGDAVAQVRALEDRPGPVVVTGSICCASAARGRSGRRVPAVRPPRGAGPPAVPRRYEVPRLRLLGTNAFRRGVPCTAFAAA